MVSRPPGVRVLRQRRVAHRVHRFDPAVRDAREVARLTGQPPESVYKTLVVKRGAGGRPLLAMLAANRELDLKALAAGLGLKRVRLASHREAERITGLEVGGISPLALLGGRFDTVIDATAADRASVLVSAGWRGWEVELPVPDLLTLTGARIMAIGSPPGCPSEGDR